MDLDRLALRAAVLKLLNDRVYKAFKEAKDEVALHLGAEGRKNATYDGIKIASVSVTKSGRFSIHNPAAFLRWVEEHHPTEVYDVPTVRPAFVEAVKRASEAAGQPMAPDGTLDIPGVGIGEPYPLVRKTPEADEIVEKLWTEGRLTVDGEIEAPPVAMLGDNVDVQIIPVIKETES